MGKILKRLGIWVLVTFVAGLVVAGNSRGIREARESFSNPQIYWKDTNQLFLMGEAIRHGMSPYLPLSDLAKQWLPLWEPYPYPSPYPPFVAVASRGFAEIGYRTTVWVNFSIEVLSFALLCAVVMNWWGVRWLRWGTLLVGAMLFTCSPFTEDIRCGQVMAMLAAVLALAWLALRSGRDVTAGVLLGFFISVKLIAWPIVAFLLLRRRWGAVVAAGSVVFGANMLALAVLGFPVMLDYYSRVGGEVASLWRGYESNLSAWCWGDRVFRGCGWGFRVQPLVEAPLAAKVATWVFPLGILAGGMALALRARALDTAIGLLCVVSVLLSPVAWSFYVLLAVVPVAVLLKRMSLSRAPAEAWGLAAAFLVLAVAPQSFSQQIARAFGDPRTVSFAAGLLLQLPNLGLLGLAWMLWRTDSSGPVDTRMPASDPAGD